ncbi:MAG: hypothetical protein LRZ88_01940 [Candidatus Cloacimonetes bacterium]|nr:hypothetical protein [Candidatus Cloacimonadota bacterium]
MSLDYKKIQEQLAAPKAECDALVQEMRGLQLPTDLPFNEFFDAYRENVLDAWEFGTLLDSDPLLTATDEDRILLLHDKFHLNCIPKALPTSLLIRITRISSMARNWDR